MKITVSGVEIEVPDGTPLEIGPDGRVRIGTSAAPAPTFYAGREVGTFLGRKTVESTYRSVTTGVALHLVEADRAVVRQAAQPELPLVEARVLPPCPQLEYYNMVLKRKYQPVWECIWEVLAQGGWYNVGAVADRLGVASAGPGKRAYGTEYAQVSLLLLRAKDQGAVAMRRPGGTGTKMWQYAEPTWARDHMTSAEVFRAKKSHRLG